jgi:hypothetical protein
VFICLWIDGAGPAGLVFTSGNDRVHQVGILPHLTPKHYALVTHCDIDANRVECTGAIKASSETLTHAAIYQLSSSIGAIVHVHSLALWERLKNVAPTTRADVAYGTPAMAREFSRLYIESEMPERCLAVMAGHPAGLISFGEVGLAGEVRPVRFGTERISEAAKQGFSLAIVPRANVPKQKPDGIEIVGVRKLTAALDATFS